MLPSGPARQPRRLRAGRAAQRLRDPPARQPHPPAGGRARAGGRRRASAKPFFTDATIGGVHARVYTAQVPTGDAVQAVRPLEEVDRTLRDLTFALVLVGLRRRGACRVAGTAGGARRAHAGEAAHRRGRARRAHARPLAPDPRRPHRRAEPPGRQLQHHARGARLLPAGRSASSSPTPRTSCAPRSRACARTSRCCRPTRCRPRTASGCCRTSSPSSGS